MTNGCDYTTVQCPNKCQVQIIRKQLKQHLAHLCPKRQYSCPDCGEKGPHDKITTEHLQQCPNAIVRCANQGCPYFSRRSNIKLHKCLYERVPCKYSDIGCRETPIRKNKEAHEQDSVHHLHLTTKMVIQLKQEVAVLKEENEMLAINAKDNREAIRKSEVTIGKLYQQVQLNKEQLRRTNSKVEELTRENAEMKKKIISLQNFNRDQNKVTFRLFPFSTHKETETDFDSDPFYSSTYGYMYNIHVCTDGGYVSVYVFLWKGANDNSLTWPFTGTFVIEPLNQLEDKNHYVQSIKLPAEMSMRVMNEGRASSGYGCPDFIAHSQIIGNRIQYLKS